MSAFYNPFRSACQRAVENEEFFNSFRRDATIKGIVETMTANYGLTCLKYIEKDKTLFNNLHKFLKSDTIGNPRLHAFKVGGQQLNIAPTTLRYVKILGELLATFGDLRSFKIVEIGVGYGGQLKIIKDFYPNISYTLVDFPEVQALAGKFVSKFHKLHNVFFRDIKDTTPVEYDLCISNYAFAEINRDLQNFYAEHILKHSKRGYLVCNIFGNRRLSDPFTREEYLEIKENAYFTQEVPQTGNNNKILIWK
jgi:hypothetical protein